MTLARVQQFITLGTLAAALAWAAFAWYAGHVFWAAAGAVLIAGGYAIFLGLEFLFLRRVHGNDPAPRATPAQLLAAWWGEVHSAPRVFCWQQPFRSRRWPDHLPGSSGGRRGLLLLHGFVCNRGLWNPWLKRLHSLDIPYIALNLEPVVASIDDYAAQIDQAVQRLERATGMPPVVVAHSMGGLALRCWWAERGNDLRVHHAITIGTPHAGTWLARFAMTANARQMRRSSPWLLALALREPEGRSAHLTCFYSHCDNIVFPASTATLPGADNRHLTGVAHVHMASRPEPWDEVQGWLVS